jgi:phage-related minor tail protein
VAARDEVVVRLRTTGSKQTRDDVASIGDEADRAAAKAEKSKGRWKKWGAVIGGAAVVGATALMKLSKDAFRTYDAGLDAIRSGTGATGATLDAFAKNMENVGKRVTQPLDQVGQVLGDLNTRTGQTGKPLEELTTQFLNLERITKESSATTVPAVTRAFGDWSTAVEDQAGALDHLYRVSQATGQTVGTLADQAVKYGAPMRQLGFDFESTTALLGKFEKEGVNTELVMGGLRQSLGRMAKAGKDPQKEFFATVKAIEAAGSAGEANKRALELFGARAGPDMAAAIREGRFSIDELMQAVGGSGETINKAAADTADFADRWAMLKNRATPHLATIGAKLSELGVKVIDFTESDRFARMADQVESFGQKAGAALDWIKRNADWLIPTVIGLVTAFTAYRAVVVAVNAVQAVAGAVTAARVGATMLLTGATGLATGAELTRNQAITASIGLHLRLAGALAASAARSVAAAAATGVHTVASKTAGAATKVWAAGQWLLNAALTANPIGLVIAAIALLVGGLVLAYKKSETFRNAVDTMWRMLKKFVGFTPLGALIKNFDTILGKIKEVTSAITDSPIGKAIGKLFGGGDDPKPIEARAVGGPVRAFQPYLVGERGPELMVPGSRGQILPHRETAALMATRPLPAKDQPGAAPVTRTVVIESGAIVIYESGDPKKTLAAVKQALSDAEADL